MYSMVLMMAISAPAEVPSWGARSGCGGSTSCVGTGCAGSCSGNCGGGCRGWGGSGIRGIFRFGGCCGGGPNFACHGAGSCAGAGYGPLTYYGFAGCYGSCYGSYTNYFSYWSTMPNVHYGYGMPARPGAVAPPPPAKIDLKPVPPAAPKKAMAPAPATIIVSLPADAILFANGIRTTQATAERRFVTPELIPGEAYHYELTVEAQRDGQTVKETRLVEVEANTTIRIDFGTLAAKAATAETTGLVIDGK